MSLLLLLGYVTISIAFLVTLQCYWRTRRMPPGPWGVPILGYLAFLDPRTPYKTLQNLAEKYGPIYSLRLGTVDVVVLSEASIVRDFLKREEVTGRAPLYVTHGIMGGNGIICAEGPLWKNQRRHVIDWLKGLGMTKKLCLPRTMLEERIRHGVLECITWFNENSLELIEFDPLPVLHHTLGNIINKLVFGITYKRDDPTWHYFQELQEEGLKLIGVSGVVNFLPFLRFLPSNHRSIQFLMTGKSKTHEIYDKIIETCLSKMKRQEKERELTEGDTESSEMKSCILEYFLAEREKRTNNSDTTAELFYNQEQLRHLLADLFGAGLDTTLTTLRWFLLYMAKHRDYQRILREKLCELSRDALTIENLEAIDYLRACIAEVQRIRSVVPLGIPHGANKDMEINGYRMPKGCMIIALQWGIHMNPKVWPNPEEFQPARFLNSDEQFHQPSQFIPFQTGKRICPGEDLARMMLLLYVGNIFRNFDVQLARSSADIDMAGECGITLAPHAYRVVMRAIDK